MLSTVVGLRPVNKPANNRSRVPSSIEFVEYLEGLNGSICNAEELLENKEKPAPELPTFGMKDFEPDGSIEQSNQIKDSISDIKNVICHERVKLLNTLSQAVWRPELCLAEVTQQTGSYWAYMGHKIGEKLYIYPEEALYLLETGSLQIFLNEVSLSVQRAYFVLLQTHSDITLEKYRVYSLLNRHGYKVLRHSPQNTVTNYEKRIEVHKLGIKLKNYHKGLPPAKREEESSSSKSNKKLKMETHLFSDTEDSNKEKNTDIQSLHDSDKNLDFDYDIYCESNDKMPFKKSCLQLPNFRVVIHNGEEPIPNFKELSRITNKYKDEIPVIHAIVFSDNIAFYRINPVILPNADDL